MISLLVLLLLGLFALWTYLNKEGHPELSGLPGPKRIPVFGNTLQFIGETQESFFLIIREFKKKYGDRFLIKVMNRWIVHINSEKDIEVVLANTKNITKGITYRFLTPWLGTGLLISTGNKWHMRRKVLTPTFHFNVLKDFASVMEEKSRVFVNSLMDKEETLVNLVPAVSDFTLYTICETAMGTQLDLDKSEEVVEYKNAILDIGTAIMEKISRIWLQNATIYSMTPAGKRFAKTLNIVHSFADKVILDKKTKRENVSTNEADTDEFGVKKRLAMLDLLLEAESKNEIDLEGIREEVNTFMFEGHDTTAMGISFALMLIADHEEVQERIYEECQSVFGESERTPSVADLAELKYVEAVVKETLRIYPSVPFISRTTTEDFMMGDLQIKKGVEIAVDIYDLHHREDLWPEPELFKPERFLTKEPRHPYAFVPFSAGPRNCIGQRFAMQEMKVVICDICRHFKLNSLQKGWRPKLVMDLVLRPAEHMEVKFIRRQKS